MCRNFPSICVDIINAPEKRFSSSVLWSTGSNSRMTNPTFPAFPRCWRSWFLRTWFASSRPTTGKGFVSHLQWSQLCVSFTYWPYQNISSLWSAVDRGVLQPTSWEVKGGSQADVSEDHFQMAHIWLSLFWSEGTVTVLWEFLELIFIERSVLLNNFFFHWSQCSKPRRHTSLRSCW